MVALSRDSIRGEGGSELFCYVCDGGGVKENTLMSREGVSTRIYNEN